MRGYPFALVLASVVVLSSASAADFTKLDRALRKEPVYSEKPRYALLVLGAGMGTRIWLVIDGRKLYVDRNGNGDLTEAGEQIEPTKESVKDFLHFQAGEFTEADGKTKHSDLHVYQYHARQFGHLVNGVIVMDVHDLTAQGTSGEDGGAFADTPKDAPVIHINGPLTMRVHSVVAGTRSRKRALDYPYELDREEAIEELHVQIGTQGLGKGMFAALSIEKKFPASLYPKVEIAATHRLDAKKVLTSEFFLKERC